MTPKPKRGRPRVRPVPTNNPLAGITDEDVVALAEVTGAALGTVHGWRYGHRQVSRGSVLAVVDCLHARDPERWPWEATIRAVLGGGEVKPCT